MYKKILFCLILFLAIALRFSYLPTVPPSASLDEATIGWNAYSILHTGRDEYGYFLPILLRAYDDYRPALYVYLVVPFVKILGLSVMSVRLPAVIMSVVTVAMTFLLTRNIFSTSKRKDVIALVSMFLLAISPWHVYVSRLGHEVNLGLTLSVAGILLFLLGINKKSGWILATSFLFFGLTFYSYQSEKVFTPLMLVSIAVIFWKQIMKMRKQLLIGVVVFLVVSAPIFFASLTPGALLRLKGTSIFTNNPLYASSANNILSSQKKGDIFGEISNNRRIVTAEIFVGNYVTHFSPFWLFGNSGDEPFKAPSTGLLYLWESPFLLLGLIYLFLSKEFSKKIKIFIILWILIDFIAPGLTTSAPHAMRAYTLLPIPQILVALGILWSLTTLNKQSKGISMGFVFLLSIIALQSLFQFVTNYFTIFPINQSNSFQYPMRDAMLYIAENKNTYNSVIVSNKNNLFQSYMFYLFYTQYSPATYLAKGGTRSGGFNETHKIDNITFRPIDWNVDQNSKGLFVGNPSDFPENLSNTVTQYNFLNGQRGVVVVDNGR